MDDFELDEALFFDAVPGAYAIYRMFKSAIMTAYPDAQLRVQKTQITFTNPRVFACASLLRARRKAELPKPWLTVTLGLPYRLESPRTAICTQVYPGRWTTHIVVSSPAEIDGELLGWVGVAYRFAVTKSACDSRLLDMEIHNRGKEESL